MFFFVFTDFPRISLHPFSLWSFRFFFGFFASFHFHTLFSHRSEKKFASVSLHFASKRKLRQFRFFFVSFSLCFIFVSLQISTFRIDAKQVKKWLFFASKRKKFRFRFASFCFEAKMTVHPSSEHLEYCMSEKKLQISEDLMILALFSDLQYSTSKCSKSVAKCPNIFWPCAVRVRQGGWGTSENEGVRGLAAATICSRRLGKIHHISSFLIVRHLVRPPVATYASCFLTCQVVSS